jgi:hypothetical protein
MAVNGCFWCRLHFKTPGKRLHKNPINHPWLNQENINGILSVISEAVSSSALTWLEKDYFELVCFFKLVVYHSSVFKYFPKAFMYSTPPVSEVSLCLYFLFTSTGSILDFSVKVPPCHLLFFCGMGKRSAGHPGLCEVTGRERPALHVPMLRATGCHETQSKVHRHS